jgi:hypothetical protein
MAAWQYDQKTETSPTLPTRQGYMTQTNPRSKGVANENSYTASLNDGVSTVYFWVHDISASFAINGGYSQSARFRRWNPRNFQAPTFTIIGQTPDQGTYGAFVEWIRTAQRRSIVAGGANTTRLFVRPGQWAKLPAYKQRTPLDMQGHIESIERIHSRWVQAPEFRFDFIVATSETGLFELDETEMISAMKGADRTIAEALTNEANPNRQFTTDPDGALGQPGSGGPH